MAQLNIDKLLKEYGLTQKDLSECTGINKNTVSKYCNGTFENINKMHIDLLCSFFDCTVNELFEINDTVEVKNPTTIIYENDTDKFEINNKSIKELKLILNSYNNSTTDSPLTKIYKENLAVQGIADAIFKSNRDKWMNKFIEKSKENDITEFKLSSKYYNKTRKVLEQQMQRLDLEHDFEENVNDLLNMVIENYDSKIHEHYKELIETYNGVNKFPLSFKLTSLYRVIYRLLSIQSDSGLREFITKLRNIYMEGDLVQLTDEELNELYDISVYYIELLNNQKTD